MKKCLLIVLSMVGSAMAATLPDGYTQLEYVESTGTQYINTGVFADPNTRVVCDYQYCTTNSPKRAGGVSCGSVVFLWGHVYNDGRTGSIVYKDWTSRPVAVSMPNLVRHTFDLKSGSQKMDGVEYGTSTFTGTATLPIVLFGYASGGTVASPYVSDLSRMRLYSCKIYDGDTLVRDYVPAMNASGTVGLYDSSQSNFVVPANGKKLYAKMMPSLPPGYSALEYVESTGMQFVDTGIHADANTRVYCDCQFTSTDSPQRCGSISSDDSATCLFVWGHANNGGTLGSIVSATWDQRGYSSKSKDTARHVFDLQPGYQTLDGAKYATQKLSTPSTRTLWLFGVNESDAYNQYVSSLRIYECRIYDGETLVRDYLPARSPQGVAGFYDLAADCFVAPDCGVLAGSAPNALPDGYTLLDCVESDGTQWLDTMVCARTNTRVVCDCQFTSTAVNQRCGVSYNDKTVFLWGQESAYKDLGSIVSTTWNQREDTKVPCDTNRHIFNLRSGWQWMDKNRYGTHSFTSPSASSMLLFSANSEGGKGLHYQCSMKIYACQIFEGERVIRNFVPAKNAQDAAGLFDMATGVFYPANGGTLAAGTAVARAGRADVLFVGGNPACLGAATPQYGENIGLTVGDSVTCSVPSGVVTNELTGMIGVCTGYKVTTNGVVIAEGTFGDGEPKSFTYQHPDCGNGAVLTWQWKVQKVLMPMGMTPIAYVEVYGQTTVDTGRVMSDHELRFSYAPTEYVEGASVVGQETGANYLHWSVSNRKYRWGLSGAEAGSEDVAWSQTRHDVVIDRCGDHAIALDGTVLSSGNPVTSNGKSIWLCARDTGKLFKGRIYSVELISHQTQEVEMRLIPAMDTYGVVGLYDEISGRFLDTVEKNKSMKYVSRPFVQIGNYPEALDGTAALSAGGTVALTVGTPYTITAKQRFYDAASKTRYKPTGWRLETYQPDGTITVVTNGEDNVRTCTFTPLKDEHSRVLWNWEVVPSNGMILFLK